MDSPIRPLRSKTAVLAGLIGIGAAILGLVVLVGWHTHSLALIQIRPSFAPMKYNTAFCFLLIGAGLAAAVAQRHWIARSLGAIAALFGILTIAEYLFGFDAG